MSAISNRSAVVTYRAERAMTERNLAVSPKLLNRPLSAISAKTNIRIAVRAMTFMDHRIFGMLIPKKNGRKTTMANTTRDGISESIEMDREERIKATRRAKGFTLAMINP